MLTSLGKQALQLKGPLVVAVGGRCRFERIESLEDCIMICRAPS